LHLCDFAVISLVYACVDRSADLLVGACWVCLLVGEPDSDAGPRIGPYHQAKILLFPTRSLWNRTCIPTLQVILWNEVWLNKTHASSPGHDNSSPPVACSDIVSLQLKGCNPPSSLPPLPVTDSLTSLKAHKLWNLGEFPCPYLSFCVSVCPRMSVCPTAANRTVGTALFPPCWCGTSFIPLCWCGTSFIPPLLVWYQLCFPVVGVVPVHFKLCANLLAKRMQ